MDLRNMLTTKQLAEQLKIKPSSIHRQLSDHGKYRGHIPHRLPNGVLAWPKSLAKEWAEQKEFASSAG
jgi:predicted DNA-binding transcriptional regulator AlpA